MKTLTLPEEVAAKLDAAAHRVRKILVLRGLAVTGAVFLAVTMLAMAADAWFTIFEDSVRYSISAGVWAATAVALFCAFWWPFRHPVTRRKAAKVLDERHPENEERLSTLVELVERSEKSEDNTSAGLFKVLARETVICANRIDVVKEFTSRTIIRRLKMLAAIAALLVVSFIVFPNVTGLLFIRAAFPWVDVGNLYSGYLEVTPGSVAVLKGTTVEIHAKALKKLPGEMMIRISRRINGGGWGREFAEPLPETGYRETADLSQREWRYRVSYGPAVSKYYTVRVCELPRYRSFSARLEYPSYTGRRPLVYTNENVGTIQAIEGTKVRFELDIAEPGTTGELRLSGGGGMNLLSDDGTLTAEMISNRVASWSMELTSADGFKSPKRGGPFVSVLDQRPSIVIENPKGVIRLPQHAKLPIAYTATDDIGLGTHRCESSIDGGEWRDVTLDEEFERSPMLHPGIEDIDLTWFDLQFVKKIAFRLIITDRYPVERGGPHAVTSTPVVVEFEVNAKNFEEQSLDMQMKESMSEMQEAEKRLETAERKAREAQNEIDRNRGEVSEQTEKKIEQLVHEVAEAEKRAEELAEKLEEDGKFEPVAEELERFAEEELAPVKEKLEEAQFASKEERRDALEAVAPMLAEAKERMHEAEEQLRERGEKLAAYERAKDLADRQEALAKSAHEIIGERPVDTKKLEAWKQMEKAAAKKAEEIAKELDDPKIDEARRKMENASQLMNDLKEDIELEHSKQLNEKQQKAKKLELEAARAKRAEQAFNAALSSEKQAEDALKKAVERREQAREQKDWRRRDQLNREADNLERTAAQRQREAEDALSLADASEVQRAQQAAATAKRREAAEAASDRVTGLKDALAAQREAIRTLEPKSAEGDQKSSDEMTGTDGSSVPAASQPREAMRQALEALREAEKAEARSLDALRRHDGAAAQNAQQEAAKAQAAARAAHQANALDKAESAERNAEQQAATAKQTGNPGHYSNAAKGQREALEALRDAEDAIAEALGADPRQLAEERRAKREADRIASAEAAAALASAQAEAAEKRNDSRGAAALKREAEKAADRAEGLRKALSAGAAQAEKEESEAAGDSGDSSQPGEPGQSGASSESRPSGQSGSSDESDTEKAPTAETEAREAADSLADAVGLQATELGLDEDGEEADEESAEQGRKKGGGMGGSKSKHDPDSRSLSAAGGGVHKELEKLAKELTRNDIPEELKGKVSKKAWFRIRGSVKEGLGERDLKDIPAEYRDLVRRYFLRLVDEPEQP